MQSAHSHAFANLRFPTCTLPRGILCLVLATAGARTVAGEISDEDRAFPAFRPLTRTTPPTVQDADRVRTPVDAFVLNRLEEKGLRFSPDADAHTLVRRAYYDLIGLPPSPAEVDALSADRSPQAYERILDGLLASPHFGERWGRHWLDAAGYVDVYGSDENAPAIRLPPGGWRYRDYVVSALNRDKPYDRFLLEQVAGDELTDWREATTFSPETTEQLVATGFLRTAIDDTDQDVLNIPSNRHATLFDQLEIFGSSVLGMTLQCARCHSHKFEPIPQRDYYRLMANFTPAYNPTAWVKLNDRTLPDVSPKEKAEIEKHNAEMDRQIAEANNQAAALRQPDADRLLDEKLTQIPEPIRADTKQAVRTPADKRNEIQKYLAGKFEGVLKVDPAAVDAALSDADRKQADAIRSQIAVLEGRKRGWGSIQALYDTGPPPDTPLLIRGEFDRPGEVIGPGFLSVLGDAELNDLSPQGETSGRRLALARWLTRPGTPAAGLVARVMVNRLWYHLMGRGIVETPGNLGRSGAPPTHPELLDWLAESFVRNGWHIKPIVKLIMTSTVYRQRSHGTAPDAANVDPDNRLWWRMELRRLESEIIRDAMLTLGGRLDRTLGGSPVPLTMLPGERVEVAIEGLPTPTSRWRRSLYLTSRRNYHVPLMRVFDMPVITTNCARRDRSAVVLQSLTLLNDAFVTDQAEAFADRVAQVAGSDQEARIDLAFQLALARKPDTDERVWSATLLDDQSVHYCAAQAAPTDAQRMALVSLCHMLLNCSEFLYVD